MEKSEDFKESSGVKNGDILSNSNDDLQNSGEEVTSVPRKRSKVSRACDACRRRKVRCDAQWSSTLQSVTKFCGNCVKNGDECTFLRIPLKRGPSKGYVRETDEKTGKTKVRKRSDDHNAKQQLPYPWESYQQSENGSAKSVALSPKTANASLSGGQRKSPIILPPLIPYQSNISTLAPTAPAVYQIVPGSNKANPNSSVRQQPYSPPIQAPFWKVPYEMPGGPGVEALESSKSNDTSPGSQGHNRRLSVESFSSASSVGSKSFAYPPNRTPSVSTDVGNSDSEDGFYSARSSHHSRKSSQSISPRNSVNSFSSLIGKINKNLNFTQASPTPVMHLFVAPTLANPPGVLVGQQQGALSEKPIPFGANVLTQPNNGVITRSFPNSQANPRLLLSAIQLDLALYYSKFHSNLPILPFQQKVINDVVEIALNDESLRLLVEYFGNVIHNLVNLQFQDNEMNIILLNRLFQLYPFDGKFALSDHLLILFLTSLVLLNYQILLSGSTYALGFSIAISVLNDFKVLENFYMLIKADELNDIDPDNIRLYIPKLNLCVLYLYDLYCLTFGLLNVMSNNRLVSFLFEHLPPLLPKKVGLFDIEAFKMSQIFHEILGLRDKNLYSDLPWEQFIKPDSRWTLKPQIESVNTFGGLFVSLLNDKYQLFDYMKEVFNILVKRDVTADEDEDLMQDCYFKLVRLTKKLTQSIINLSNFISTNTLPYNSPGGNDGKRYPLLSPILNLSYSQAYKMIKFCKLIVDSFLNFKDQELVNRCIKLNNDLSIAFNLLNSSLNAGPSPFVALGHMFLVQIKMKIEMFNLSFNIRSYGDRNVDSNAWKSELFTRIKPFMDSDLTDGWY